MTGTDPVTRAIDACRRAGLPVIEAKQCTYGLRGRLVVLDGPDGLRILWPYDGRCPVHGPRDREAPRPTRRPRPNRSRSTATRHASAQRRAGAR
jgi:hypothetical protein